MLILVSASFAVLASALTAIPLPRIDTDGTSVDWLHGVVRGDGIAEPCVVTGKSTDECMWAGEPSARIAEADAIEAVLRRVMTLIVRDDCTGYEAMQREPALKKLVRSRAQATSARIGADHWRGNAVLSFDVELVRAFANACAPRPPFTDEEQKQLLLDVDVELRAWRTGRSVFRTMLDDRR